MIMSVLLHRLVHALCCHLVSDVCSVHYSGIGQITKLLFLYVTVCLWTT